MDPAFARTPNGRVLRLVNDADDSRPTVLHSRNVSPESRGPAWNVSRANVESAGLSTDDARWIFAQEVRDSLEGGRAAILPPAQRRELVASALRSGLRPFDANLVIAIVQDDVRTGARKASPSSPPAGLQFVRKPDAPLSLGWLLAVVSVIAILALSIASLLISWVLG